MVTVRENYFLRHFSGHTDSDTGLEFLSCEEVEKKDGHTHTHTHTEGIKIIYTVKPVYNELGYNEAHRFHWSLRFL